MHSHFSFEARRERCVIILPGYAKRQGTEV